MPDNQGDNALMDVLPSLRRFALSLARNADDAEDLVQEVSLRLVRNAAPEGADLKHWSFRVCKNVWIDQLRRKKVRADASNDVLEQSPTIEDGEGSLVGRSELESVMRIMSTLPEDQQIALSLVALEGMSYREVSEVMEVPIGTVMSRIARARKQIADRLANQVEDTHG